MNVPLQVIVLGARDDASGLPIGFTDNYIKILLEGSTPPPGTLAAARITRSDGLICYGTITG